MIKLHFTRKTLSITFLSFVAFVFVAATQAVSHRIFTIGDSTVQDYTTGYAPRKGWGQMLPLFFSSTDVQILNRAVGGTSSKSFYNLFWTNAKAELKSGDFVLIQFGINDRNKADTARAAYGEVFKGYIRKYVNEARAKGAIPILVASLRRNAWNADGITTYDSYHEHPQLMREVATELNVPLIDLDQKAKAGMEKAGADYCKWFWYNNYPAGEYTNYPNGNADDVHFQEMGALQMAKYVVEGIKELSSNSSINKLIPFLKPQYRVAISVNHPEAGLVTLTETYPEGANIHIKALANTGHTFVNWKGSTGVFLSSKNLVQFTMAAKNQSYVAFFDDELGQDCAGIYGGKAQLDDCGICTGGTTGRIACTKDCNGDLNGTAKLDACGVCTGGKSINKVCATTIEAETACTLDGTIDNNNAGFGGTGFVNSTNAIGAYATYRVTSSTTQTATLSFKYANGGTSSRDGVLKINGVSVGNVALAPTGSWTTWFSVAANISLTKGTNEITLTASTADGLANLDALSFSAGVSNAGCVITETSASVSTNEFVIYPNPTSGLVYLSGETVWEIHSSSGVFIEKGKSDRLTLEGLAAGLYFIKTKEKTYKVVKQ